MDGGQVAKLLVAEGSEGVAVGTVIALIADGEAGSARQPACRDKTRCDRTCHTGSSARQEPPQNLPQQLPLEKPLAPAGHRNACRNAHRNAHQHSQHALCFAARPPSGF